MLTRIAPAPARMPRVYCSDEVVTAILDRIADGEPLTKICSVPELPTRKAFFEWVAADKSLQMRYELAMELRAEQYVEETIAIADDSSKDTYVDGQGNVRIDHEVIGRSKLKIEARMWYAAKIAPKKYGNRRQVEVDEGLRIKPEDLDDRIAALLRKAAGGR